mgnify:CR=1 FL=1
MSRNKTLPNGQVPFSDINDPVVRDRIMRLGENDKALAAAVAKMQAELEELKKKAR